MPQKIVHVLLMIAAGALAFAPDVWAEGRAVDEKAEAVESLLRAAEADAARAFDPAYRERARQALTRLSLDELMARRERVRIFGLGGRLAPGDRTRDLVFTPVPPCRVADTRLAGGSLAPGAPRELRVTGIGLQTQGGENAGCLIPVGPATAAVLNFVVVNPVGPGNLRAWAYSTPPVGPPNASIINYAAVPGLNLANGIVVPLCDLETTACPSDLRVQADASGTHLVMDVVGFFQRSEEPTLRVGTFTIPAGTAPGDFQVSGVGFKPQLVEFSILYGEGGGTTTWGTGAMNDDGNQWSIGFYVDGGAPGASQYSDSAACIHTGSAGLELVARYKSMDADGFTVTLANLGWNAWDRQVHYIAHP